MFQMRTTIKMGNKEQTIVTLRLKTEDRDHNSTKIKSSDLFSLSHIMFSHTIYPTSLKAEPKQEQENPTKL